MAIKITKKQEYVDDVPQIVKYDLDIIRDNGYLNKYVTLDQGELLELKEAINKLDIK